MAEVNFSFAYMYMYSERPGTLAAKRFSDDIPEDVKNRRLNEIIEQQHRSSHKRVLEQLGKVQKVLIEGYSKKSVQDYAGRSDQNTTVIFPVDERFKPGDYVHVLAESCTTATLIGKIID
jgi:tRNA-2-methylthio-N6-dimethylallyladenosine synthase